MFRPKPLVVFLLAALSGFLSLSQELVWMRILGLLTGGRPSVFAHVLGVLLLGIAAGSLAGKRLCEAEEKVLWRFLFFGAMAAALLFFLALPAISLARHHGVDAAVGLGYALVWLTALLWGASFPILCQSLERPGSSAGWLVAWVYLFNILGSTAGPLVTGFILLERFSLEGTVFGLMAGILLFGVMAALLGEAGAWTFRCGVLGALLVLGLSAASAGHLYRQWPERLQFGAEHATVPGFRHVLQNRYGIVTVQEGETDVLYGGGVYDGQFTTDPVLDANGIRRAFMVAGLHPQPQKVLMIGLGSGSWARVLANHQDVRHLTVVEINPAYKELLSHYPESATLLNDPKVDLVFGDGRKWLMRHPQERFDLIVMNASFHWRNQMTYLLSDEFFALCKQHLKEGGVLYLNTTFSKDVVYTLAHGFGHITLFGNFAAASDRPFVQDAYQRYQNLLKFEQEGRPVFDQNDPGLRQVLEELALTELKDLRQMVLREKELLRITDDNMATEFKTTRRWYDPAWSWGRLFRSQ